MDLVEFKSEHIMVEELPKAVNGLAEHVESEKTPEERREFKRVLRKIDLTILPMLGIMSFMESMARGDVGNAAVLGMQRQLNITPQQLSHCISFFFIGYVVFQLPGMLFLRVLTPPAQLGFALMFWGTFVTLLCIAENYATIAGFRVLIGIGEAFMQAAPVYLTLWYKREQLALRIGILFSVAAIAGSFNGLISYGIYIDINGVHGWPAWKWLFFVQGIIAVGFGIVTFLFLPPVPEKLRWPFTLKEREIAIRMSKEAYNVPHASISPKQLYAVLKDPQSWYLAIIFGALNASLACFSGFLPVIIKSFGFSLLKTEILVIPVYVCVTISILIFAAISDHLRKRGLLLIIAFVIAATGWIMIIVSRSRSVSFAATFLAGMGTYPLVIISIAWVNTNVVGFTKRAGTFALMQTVGQSLAIGGTEIYSDPPHYYRGNGFALGACVVGIIATIGLLFHLRAKNTYKLQNQNTEDAARARALGIEEVWDDHPDFFYVL